MTRVLWVVLVLFSTVVWAQEEQPPFFAKVIEVTSTNSLVVETEGNGRQQVVLAFLSIPMGNQPYAARAHEILRAQLLNRRISIRPIGGLHEGFVNGIVYVGSNNFNLDFIERGHAWVDYFQVSHPAWMVSQQRARASGTGLYADPDAIHPLRWKEDKDQAEVIVAATQEMAADPLIKNVMNDTFVGNRSEMVFVATRCIDTWSQWKRSVLIPFTTTAGAEDNGYRLIACDNPGNPVQPQ